MRKDEKQMDLFTQQVSNNGEAKISEYVTECPIPPMIPNMLDLMGGGLNIMDSVEPVTENRYEKIRDTLTEFDLSISPFIDEYLKTGKLTKTNFTSLRSLLMNYMGTDEECVKFLKAYSEDIKKEASLLFSPDKNSLAINMLVDVIMSRLDALIPKYRSHVSKAKKAESKKK